MNKQKFAKASIQFYIYLVIVTGFYLFVSGAVETSPVLIVVAVVCVPLLLYVNRFLFSRAQQYFRKSPALTSKVIIIGYNNLSKKLACYLEEEAINKEVIGYCEEYENVHELSNYPVLGSISQTMEACRRHGVTEIYSTIAPEHNRELYGIMQSADENCIRFRIVPDLGVFFKRSMHIEYMGEMPVISLRNEPLENLENRIKKRAFDLVLSTFIILFVLSWLIPLAGLLIWLESRGPIFFRQERTGKNNKKFNCLKFRSMHMNCNADLQQATPGDERVTRIGRFLRSTNLDEFPQFLNVLCGHMSIVGPRPHMLKHTDEYSKIIEQYMVRQFLKPGITGWAQVNGFRGETRNVLQMQKRVEHDLWYLENWSLVFDVKIIMMTIFNTLRGEENAY
ncbi:MAG TPA: undecaprenyl-phosphate glucose phosphotransferase [Chitinophagaceae bacterium]|nr:undecaprenyl-phosphate glucose phosphotransferase [Chitinophagaceae bacterium]